MLLSYLSTGLSTVALVFALLALVVSHRRVAMPQRKLHDIELELGDHAHDIASIRSTTKRLNARIGLREAREKPNGDAPQSSSNEWAQRPNETPYEWKARLRKGPLLRGIKPPGVT